MKRSKKIRLLLAGAFLSTLFIGCSSDENEEEEASENVAYQNNHYISGAGYYHAPYHGWYSYPYNYYEPQRGYYYGGRWNESPAPAASLTESRPTAAAVSKANQAHSSHIARSGFGRSGFSSHS